MTAGASPKRHRPKVYEDFYRREVAGQWSLCYAAKTMNVNLPVHKNSGMLASLWQWLNVNPLVNLIQLIAGGSMVVLLSIQYTRSLQEIPRLFWITNLLLGVIWVIARAMAHHYKESPGSKMTLLWIGATALLVEAITITSGGEFPRILYVLLPFIAVFYLPRNLSLAITFGTVCWVTISYMFLPHPQLRYPLQTLMFLVIIYLGGYGLGYALRQERRAREETQRLLSELAETNDQLMRYAAEAAQVATMRERNRIAREIHDSLGHFLTVIGVQLEKGITFEAVNREEARQAVRAAKQLTDQALTEVRNSVGALRETGEELTLHSALQALVETMQQSGLSVALCWRGDEHGFSEQQLLTLFRAAQEGLTNVQKHAKAQRVQIEVALDAEAAMLRLTDDGIGFNSQRLQTHGYGLQGLRERVELAQGTLTLGRSPSGGAQLVVRLPKEGCA